MQTHVSARQKEPGLPPGSLVHIGERKTEKARITIIDYSESQYLEKIVDTVEETFPYLDEPTNTWINVDGIHDVDLIRKLGEHFKINPLALEDILNTEQRPKTEVYEDFVFIVLKMLTLDREKKEIQTEQLSIVLGSNFLITFQEIEGDDFNPIREQLKNPRGRFHKGGTVFLAYTLIDVVVDSYFKLLEDVGEHIEDMEVALMTKPNPAMIRDIQNLKRELIYLRKSVWPLREVISGFERCGASIIQDSMRPFLRDLYDHTIQVIDTIETFRDMLSGMVDIYLSSMSNRMNEVMKVLTLIATIFMPLSVVAGIYGMNFKYMPELERPWAYPAVLVLMLIVGALMVAYFKRRRWI